MRPHFAVDNLRFRLVSYALGGCRVHEEIPPGPDLLDRVHGEGYRCGATGHGHGENVAHHVVPGGRHDELVTVRYQLQRVDRAGGERDDSCSFSFLKPPTIAAVISRVLFNSLPLHGPKAQCLVVWVR